MPLYRKGDGQVILLNCLTISTLDHYNKETKWRWRCSVTDEMLHDGSVIRCCNIVQPCYFGCVSNTTTNSCKSHLQKKKIEIKSENFRSSLSPDVYQSTKTTFKIFSTNKKVFKKIDALQN